MIRRGGEGDGIMKDSAGIRQWLMIEAEKAFLMTVTSRANFFLSIMSMYETSIGQHIWEEDGKSK